MRAKVNLMKPVKRLALSRKLDPGKRERWALKFNKSRRLQSPNVRAARPPSNPLQRQVGFDLPRRIVRAHQRLADEHRIRPGV
jgi:hypothetical protein